MKIQSTDLLKLLGSGIRPGGGIERSSTAVGGSFADLLRQATEGSLTSGLPVSIGQDAGVTLDSGQLSRVAAAADKLETAGVRTALVTIDGQKLVLDVHARQITGKAGDENGLVSGVDGAFDLGDLRETAGAAQVGASAAVPTDSRSLMKLLAELRQS